MNGRPYKGRVIATIECRMTSSRLFGKVLMEAIDGKSMLEIMAERVKEAQGIDEIILATTTNANDDAIERLAAKLHTGCFRGSEEDVLSRVLGAAKKYKGDVIVELTGDCPLIDPEIITQVLDCYMYNKCDYAANCEPMTYPIGMETQVFSVKCLEKSDREGRTPPDREHVSWYIRKHPDIFRHLALIAPVSLKRPDISVTLDEMDDYKLITAILKRLYLKNRFFNCRDIVKLLTEDEPSLLGINEHVMRRS